MVMAKRVGSNPLDTLSLLNAKVDVRRGRRELTADELRALLAATRTATNRFRGLAGEDRYHLYLAAATTGFRARALSHLTPADFDLESEPPTVTLAARFNKSRKPKVQPLPPDVVVPLRAYLSDRPKGQPVWGGTWARDKRGAQMIRGDLARAGIAYAVASSTGRPRCHGALSMTSTTRGCVSAG
jgi:integrase